ncbi:MAG: rRNA maturation RNase YbeY [Bacteroidota bacterium]
MASVQFFTEDITFKIPQPRKTKEWILAVARKEKATVRSLVYIFCSDSYLLQLNEGYLKHHTLTDIITFDYSEGRALEGEIYISVERVAENAQKFKTDFRSELNRVIIHGVLHLAGYKDKKPAEKALMRKKEDAYLSLLK